MTTRRSYSVGNVGDIGCWIKENKRLFVMRLTGLKNKERELTVLLNEIDSYGAKYKSITGRKLDDASIFEIGYGSRPNRLIALMSLNFNARGIDLDRPILNGRISEFMETYKKNGLRRSLKSLVRHTLFDNHERRALGRVLKARGGQLRVDESRFLVGDASAFKFPTGSIDFIYSEDVFEHIPPDSIHRLCENLHGALSPSGLALISPAVFTGIAGSHLVEWYPHTLGSKVIRNSEPWEHLRKRRYHADCYLNKLRVQEFRDIFEKYFDVIDVVNIDPGLGKQFLTSDIRDELSMYSEIELLSHKWTFVLKQKAVSN